MKETYSIPPNLYRNTLCSICRPYVDITFMILWSLTELASCVSFNVRKVSFRAREALYVQGALQIKKQTLNPFIDGNEWKQAVSYVRRTRNCPFNSARHYFHDPMEFDTEWQQILYIGSQFTVLVTVQNTCKPISRLKMNGNRLIAILKKTSLYSYDGNVCPFPQTLSKYSF